jgi:sulfofructose kinase
MTAVLEIDVLCVGHASYDLVFAVPRHPEADEKLFADTLIACGGGPAANAAVTVARLGYQAAFAGYLGNDAHGDLHYAELLKDGVHMGWITRGASPTPLSTVLVKPDGRRALVNFKGETRPLPSGAIDFADAKPKVILFDGHEPNLSGPLLQKGIPSVLDAGSVHPGTLDLMFAVDYLACSEKFARQWLGEDAPERALAALAERSPTVVITLGERGLIWRRGNESGALPAYPAQAIDTTGAGDAFHGAFAAALAAGLDWPETLRLASAAGSLCCETLGARPGIPDRKRLEGFLESCAKTPEPFSA